MCDNPLLPPQSPVSFQFPHVTSVSTRARPIPAHLLRAPQHVASPDVPFRTRPVVPPLPRSFLDDASERSLFPPVPVTRYVLASSLDGAQEQSSAASLSTMSTTATPQPAPSRADRIDLPQCRGATARKTPWETLQDDAAANAAYASKVREAKQLLRDFRLYQLEQQQQQQQPYTAPQNRSSVGGGRWDSRLPASPIANPLGASSQVPPGNSSRPYSVSASQFSATQQAGVLNEVVNGSRGQALEGTKRKVPPQGIVAAEGVSAVAEEAAASESTKLTAAASSFTQSNAERTRFGPDIVADEEGKDSSGTFDLAAFEVAKRRARRLLLYNAKAQAAYCDRGLSLTRAVYKELLQRPPTLSAIHSARAMAADGTTELPFASPDAAHVAARSPATTKATAAPEAVKVEDTQSTAAAPVEGPAPASTPSVKAAAQAVEAAEAKRALDLLCGIRAMRRQTEELTVALLYACGEWSCWEAAAPPDAVDPPPSPQRSAAPVCHKSPRPQHLFADLFLTTDSASRVRGPAAGDDEENEGGAVAFYEEEIQRRRARACAKLREALHLCHHPTHGADSGASSVPVDVCAQDKMPPAAAAAFLRLAEAPPKRVIPPPPSTSAQLALFAAQQHLVREALLYPQPASLRDERNAKKSSEAGRRHQAEQQDGMTSDSQDEGGVYRLFQRQLHDLRVERRRVQQTYDTLLSTAAASKACNDDPAVKCGLERCRLASPPQQACMPAKQDLTFMDKAVLTSSEAAAVSSPSPALLPSDTLLSSPPDPVVEKTRPWSDSVNTDDGSTSQPTPDHAAEATSAAAVVAAPVRGEPAEVVRTTAVKLFSPTEGRLSPVKRSSNSNSNNNNAANRTSSLLKASSKAQPLAAAAAATARLLPSSADSSASSVTSAATVRKNEEEEAGVLRSRSTGQQGPRVAVSTSSVKETVTRGGGAAHGESAMPACDREDARLPSAAAVTATSGKRREAEAVTAYTTSLRDSKTRAKKEVRSEHTTTITAAALPSTSQARQQHAVSDLAPRGAVANTREGKKRVESGEHGAAMASSSSSRLREHSGVEPTQSEDDYSTTYSEESGSSSSSSNVSSCSSSSGNVRADPYLCAASWHPYLKATLSRHADATGSAAQTYLEEQGTRRADSPSRKAVRSSSSSSSSNSSNTRLHPADRRSVRGMNVNVYATLSRWVAAQRKGEKRDGMEGKAETAAAEATSILSSDELKEVSRWLRQSAKPSSKGQPAHNKKEGECLDAAGAATAPPPPLPAAVQKALEVVFRRRASPTPRPSPVPYAEARPSPKHSSGADEGAESAQNSEFAKSEREHLIRSEVNEGPRSASSTTADVQDAGTTPSREASGDVVDPSAAAAAAAAAAASDSAVGRASSDSAASQLRSAAPSDVDPAAETEESSADSTYAIPPVHPRLRVASSTPSDAGRQPTSNANVGAGEEKLVSSPRKKSFFKRLFGCGGR